MHNDVNAKVNTVEHVSYVYFFYVSSRAMPIYQKLDFRHVAKDGHHYQHNMKHKLLQYFTMFTSWLQFVKHQITKQHGCAPLVEFQF